MKLVEIYCDDLKNDEDALNLTAFIKSAYKPVKLKVSQKEKKLEFYTDILVVEDRMKRSVEEVGYEIEKIRLVDFGTKDHLPLYGIGPLYVYSSIAFTIVMIVLKALGVIGYPNYPMLKAPFILLGILFIILGLYFWVTAVVESKIYREIAQNHLVTTGVYGRVRNPIYSAALFICTGAVLIANDLLLLIVPVILWLYMTLLLIFTEEKWLTKLYGEKYEEYKKKVNRCIPDLFNSRKQ